MQDRLPPGAFSLRHGFPRWYSKPTSPTTTSENGNQTKPSILSQIHVVDILRYIRSAFESSTALDAVPFEAAGNPGAWYAWQAYRKKILEKEQSRDSEGTPSGHARTPSKSATGGHARSPSKGTPSGHARARSKGVIGSPNPNGDTPNRAKRPSEWNWEGVWEQRVKRAVNDSLAEPVLFGAGAGPAKEDDIHFANLPTEEVEEIHAEMRQHLHLPEDLE